MVVGVGRSCALLMMALVFLQIEADLKELSVILCLGAKETNEIRSDVAGALYKRLLREEVTSRRIDEAASPAQVRPECLSG